MDAGCVELPARHYPKVVFIRLNFKHSQSIGLCYYYGRSWRIFSRIVALHNTHVRKTYGKFNLIPVFKAPCAAKPRDGPWCRKEDSNLRPTHYECVALPTELFRQINGLKSNFNNTGRFLHPLLTVISVIQVQNPVSVDAWYAVNMKSDTVTRL